MCSCAERNARSVAAVIFFPAAIFFAKFWEKDYKKDMDIENLEKVLEGEPKFRVKQANEAVLKSFIADWQEATFFSKDLRDKLNVECPLVLNTRLSFVVAETVFLSSIASSQNNDRNLLTIKLYIFSSRLRVITQSITISFCPISMKTFRLNPLRRS